MSRTQWLADAFGGTMFPRYRIGARRTYETLADGHNSINLHSYGVSKANFDANEYVENDTTKLHESVDLVLTLCRDLKGVLRALGTSHDRNGKEFLAAAEGVWAPIFVTQFHPEMVIWEWTTSWEIPHSQVIC